MARPGQLPGRGQRLKTVGIADLSHLGKFEVRGTGAAPSGNGDDLV